MDKDLVQSNFSVSSSLPPNPNIMGGSSSHFGEDSSGIEFDKMVLNLSVDTSSSDLLDRLQVVKNHLQETDFETESCFSLTVSSGMVWNVQRVGVARYPYVLKFGDIALLLSSRSSDSSIPSARLEIGSMSCQNDISSVYESVRLFLSHHNVSIVSNSVSRVDLCADIKGVSIQDRNLFLFDDYRFITRARFSAVFKQNRKITGVQFGRGDIVARIYDKVTELLKPENSEKLIFFREKWGFFPDHCTRVEFQLRKSVLNQFGIKSFEDSLNSIDSLWNYLTREWLRHTSSEVDFSNKNHSRSRISFFWSIVQNFSKSRTISKRFVNKSLHKSMSMLTAQLRGLLTTIAAGMGHQSNDVFSLVSTCQQIVTDEITRAFNQPDWKTIFMTRQRNTLLVYDEPEFSPTPDSILFRCAVQGELLN